MKKYLIFLLLLICSVSYADTWTPSPIKPIGQIGAGGEGWQKAFAVEFAPSNGNIVYRVNDTSGVWKSTDAGASWFPWMQGFRFIGGSSIGIHPTDPNIVLVGGSSMESAADVTSLRESGISRTTDGGANWTTATSTTNGANYSYLRNMFAREKDKTQDLFAWVGGGTSTVYCGTARQGILRSTDLGATWKVVVPYSITGQIYDMDLRGTGSNANKIIVASTNGLTQYTDDGSDPNGYISTATSGISGARTIEVNQNDTNIMYAANSTQLYKSTTGLTGFSTSGVDNTEFSPATTNSNQVRSLRLCDANTNKIYIHFQKDATSPETPPYSYWYSSTNSGVDFTIATDGSWDDDGTVAKFGAYVAATEGSDGGSVIACDPSNENIVLSNNTYEQVVKSTNSGASFTYSNIGYCGYTPISVKGKSNEAFISGSSTSIRVGNDFGVWLSGNTYSNYRRLPEPTLGRSDFSAVAIEPGTSTPVVIAAYTQNARKVLGTDGYTYTCIYTHAASAANRPISGGSHATYWQKTGSGGSTWVTGTLYTDIDASYIFHSPAGSFGNTWTLKTPAFSGQGGGCKLISFNGSDTNYISSGVYRSTDKGVSWASTYGNGVLDVYTANNDIVYSITGSGICRMRKCTNARAATPTFADASPAFTLTGGWQTGEGFCSSPNNPDKWYVPAGDAGVWVVTGTSTALKNNANGLITDATRPGDWNYRICVADPNNPNTIYALAQCHPNFRGGGIFMTTDGGISWESISSGTELGFANSVSMSVDPNTSYLHVHGFSGTWVYNADAPLIDIEIPTTLNYYGTSSATVTISGSASDADGIDTITYVMTGDTTGSGIASGTTAWSKAALAVNTGTTTITFTALDLSGNSATDYIVIGRAATLPENEEPDMIFPYTSETITINGAATESIWGDAVAHPIDLVISGNPIGTVSAEVKGLWDENYIYVLITATDTTKNNDTGTTAVHLDTAGEVYWDADNSGGAYAEGDFHFIFPWNQSDFIWEVGGNTSTVSSSMSSTANGYTLEAKFPWSLLGISATNSTTLAADFQTDTDVDGGNTRELAMSAFNAFDTNYYDLSDLGLISLGTQTQAEGGGGAGSSTVTKITGLLANWNFNETSGSSTFDTSVNLNHGTMSANAGTSSCSRQLGRDGSALQVIGSCSVNCGSPASLDDIGTRTTVAVVRATADSGSICGKSGVILNTGYNYFELSSTNALWFTKDFSTTDINVLSANSVLVPNTWQTLAMTWSGTDTPASINYYIDGESVAQTGAPIAGIGSLVSDADRVYFIGNRGLGNQPFSGLLDNLQNYSRVLTAQELRDTAAFVQGTTSTALSITSLTASLYGSASISFGTTTIAACFDYGVASGVYTGSTTAQNTGRTTVGVSDVIHAVSGLTAGTTYYYRLRVESPAYTVYGAESSFVTLSADAAVPTIGINYPTSAANYQTSSSLPLLVTGTSSDNVSVTQVVWTNETIGTSGVCTGTTQWNVQELPIQEGTNTCKFTVFDAANNQATATVSIFRNLDTPVVEITSPEPNCTLSDGTPAIGTTGVLFTLSGLASDSYNGITQVDISNNKTTTVSTATGTDSFTSAVRVLPILDDGLVAYYKFDETTGSQIKDYSVFKSHGTNTGSIGTTNSHFGGSRYFDGIDDYVDFGDPSDGHLDHGTNSSSFTFWLKAGTTTTSAQWIYAKSTDNCGIDISLRNGNNHCAIYYGDQSQYLAYDTVGYTGNMRDLQWHHVGVVFNRSVGLKFFVDGIQYGTDTNLVSVSGNMDVTSSAYLGIYRSLAHYKLNGSLDEVRIYNKALSQAEITQLYQLTTPDQTNNFSATGYDTPLLNQGTDTIAIGAFPTTQTADATLVTINSATFNGTCSANSNTSTVWFEYGLATGEYTGSSSTTVITDNDVSIEIPIAALNLGTEYFYRIRASNNVGETYGGEFSFITDDRVIYTLEEVTGLSKPLSWSMIGSTRFRAGLKAYGIYNPWTRWRSTADKKRLIDDPDNEITDAIEDL